MADDATTPIPTARPGERCRVINPDTGAQLGGDQTTLDKIEGTMAWVLLRPSIRPGQEYDRACYPVDWIQAVPGRQLAVAALIAPILEEAGFTEVTDQAEQLVAAAAWLLVLAGWDDEAQAVTGTRLGAVVIKVAQVAAGWVDQP